MGALAVPLLAASVGSAALDPRALAARDSTQATSVKGPAGGKGPICFGASLGYSTLFVWISATGVAYPVNCSPPAKRYRPAACPHSPSAPSITLWPTTWVSGLPRAGSAKDAAPATRCARIVSGDPDGEESGQRSGTKLCLRALQPQRGTEATDIQPRFAEHQVPGVVLSAGRDVGVLPELLEPYAVTPRAPSLALPAIRPRRTRRDPRWGAADLSIED